MGDDDCGNGKDYEVIGPYDSEDEIRWLPSWFINVAIPVIASVNPETRAGGIDQNECDTYSGSGGAKVHVVIVLGYGGNEGNGKKKTCSINCRFFL